LPQIRLDLAENQRTLERPSHKESSEASARAIDVVEWKPQCSHDPNHNPNPKNKQRSVRQTQSKPKKQTKFVRQTLSVFRPQIRPSVGFGWIRPDLSNPRTYTGLVSTDPAGSCRKSSRFPFLPTVQIPSTSVFNSRLEI
jgi:hypothetical protein